MAFPVMGLGKRRFIQAVNALISRVFEDRSSIPFEETQHHYNTSLRRLTIFWWAFMLVCPFNGRIIYYFSFWLQRTSSQVAEMILCRLVQHDNVERVIDFVFWFVNFKLTYICSALASLWFFWNQQFGKQVLKKLRLIVHRESQQILFRILRILPIT